MFGSKPKRAYLNGRFGWLSYSLFHLLMVGCYLFAITTGWAPPRALWTFPGPFELYWYAFFLVAGILAGVFVAIGSAKQAGDSPHVVWRGLAWLLVLGFLGARIGYIILPPPSDQLRGIVSAADYWQNLTLFLNVRQGGLNLLGGLLGGLVGWLIFSMRYRLPLLVWLDRLSLGGAVGAP